MVFITSVVKPRISYYTNVTMEAENAIKLSDKTIQNTFRCIATRKRVNIYSIDFYVERNNVKTHFNKKH
jgi:hypothetical protein